MPDHGTAIEWTLEFDKLAAEVARAAASAFRKNGWEWDRCGIPDEANIALEVRRLLTRAADLDDGYSADCGRFSVCHWFEDGEEKFSVSLEMGDIERPVPGSESPQG